MYNNEYKLYEKEYYNHKYRVKLGYNTDEWSAVEIDYQTGRNFDRDFYLLSWYGRMKVLKKLSLDYSGVYVNYSPDTTNASKTINILSANYYITKEGGPHVDLFFIPVWLILGAMGFSILVSLLAGLYPAIRAARVDPVEALRHD